MQIERKRGARNKLEQMGVTDPSSDPKAGAQPLPFKLEAGETKVSTSLVAALFSQKALTGQRLSCIWLCLVVQHYHIHRRGWMEPEFLADR